ncbi:glutamate-5-semialdehyde dehydrogenase [Halobacteriovorax sp.]|uniref:glutamate-5-semialdehyde dehydrogenase n=1 Tax=Halobacteriovorax sp. TaxID=2020862 RepID=UPI003566445E
MNNFAKKSKDASKILRGLKKELRKEILFSLAKNLMERSSEVIEANKKDLAYAEEVNLGSSLKDRLMLDEARIEDMANGVKAIAEQDEVVGEFYKEFTNAEGLRVKRQRVPLGVILMIFESRPNVVIDCAALALKSSNAIILKGGKEAKHSNEILGEIIQDTLDGHLPKETVQVLASDSREEVNKLLELEQYIDVVIPRGGERLIEHVYKNAKMPVIAHFKGLCHMYLDKDADLNKAMDLVINAKTQRTGVCNAIETLLIHENLPSDFKVKLASELESRGTELRVDDSFMKSTGSKLKLANEEDWATEYLDNILSIKTVCSIDEAIDHIDEHGSFHTESIVSENENAQNEFISRVDASCVAINASSRFNDGGQLGLGAELGISTTKLHAYGPMGAEQMTTSRYVIVGDGNIRG